MNHLTWEQIENYAEGRERALDAHVADCAQCQHEIAAERRLTHALTRLERFSPSPEFTAQLDRALEQAESNSLHQALKTRRPSVWTGIAALLASLLLLIFASQTILLLQEGGALDFLLLYFSRPDLLSMYPSESLNALIESLPLVEFILTLGLLYIAITLAQQFFGGANALGQTMGKSER